MASEYISARSSGLIELLPHPAKIIARRGIAKISNEVLFLDFSDHSESSVFKAVLKNAWMLSQQTILDYWHRQNFFIFRANAFIMRPAIRSIL